MEPAKKKRKKYGGRQKGSTNARSKRLKSEARSVFKIVNEHVPGAFEGDSVAFLIAVYKHPDVPLTTRIDAAKAISKFERAALQSIEFTGKNGAPVELNLNLPPTEIARRLTFALRKGLTAAKKEDEDDGSRGGGSSGETSEET